MVELGDDYLAADATLFTLETGMSLLTRQRFPWRRASRCDIVYLGDGNLVVDGVRQRVFVAVVHGQEAPQQRHALQL